jgi:hypothetical protein
MSILIQEKEEIAKSFLRWAGGKTWLIKHLGNIKKNKYNNYHEAFFGGAAMTQLWYSSGNIGVLPSDPYSYAIIKYNGDKEFIFTSLMASDVESVMKQIAEVPLERKLRPIPSPMLSKLFGW